MLDRWGAKNLKIVGAVCPLEIGPMRMGKAVNQAGSVLYLQFLIDGLKMVFHSMLADKKFGRNLRVP